jgi:hypothetical protein
VKRDLAPFADGSLRPRGRARVQRALAGSPELRAQLREQRCALAALRSLRAESAPVALRVRVVAADRRVPARRLRRLPRAGAALAASSLALALALVALGGSEAGPTVAAAAALGTRPPLAPVAPPRHDGHPPLLRLRAAGLPFPYWDDQFGWRAVGTRRDELGDRPVVTVFYADGARRVAYTIVAGLALPSSAGAWRTVRDHTLLQALSIGSRLVVTWQRRGHTCVLSAENVPIGTLLALAAWRAGGKLPY